MSSFSASNLQTTSTNLSNKEHLKAASSQLSDSLQSNHQYHDQFEGERRQLSAFEKGHMLGARSLNQPPRANQRHLDKDLSNLNSICGDRDNLDDGSTLEASELHIVDADTAVDITQPMNFRLSKFAYQSSPSVFAQLDEESQSIPCARQSFQPQQENLKRNEDDSVQSSNLSNQLFRLNLSENKSNESVIEEGKNLSLQNGSHQISSERKENFYQIANNQRKPGGFLAQIAPSSFDKNRLPIPASNQSSFQLNKTLNSSQLGSGPLTFNSFQARPSAAPNSIFDRKSFQNSPQPFQEENKVNKASYKNLAAQAYQRKVEDTKVEKNQDSQIGINYENQFKNFLDSSRASQRQSSEAFLNILRPNDQTTRSFENRVFFKASKKEQPLQGEITSRPLPGSQASSTFKDMVNQRKLNQEAYQRHLAQSQISNQASFNQANKSMKINPLLPLRNNDSSVSSSWQNKANSSSQLNSKITVDSLMEDSAHPRDKSQKSESNLKSQNQRLTNSFSDQKTNINSISGTAQKSHFNFSLNSTEQKRQSQNFGYMNPFKNQSFGDGFRLDKVLEEQKEEDDQAGYETDHDGADLFDQYKAMQGPVKDRLRNLQDILKQREPTQRDMIGQKRAYNMLVKSNQSWELNQDLQKDAPIFKKVDPRYNKNLFKLKSQQEKFDYLNRIFQVKAKKYSERVFEKNPQDGVRVVSVRPNIKNQISGPNFLRQDKVIRLYEDFEGKQLDFKLFMDSDFIPQIATDYFIRKLVDVRISFQQSYQKDENQGDDDNETDDEVMEGCKRELAQDLGLLFETVMSKSSQDLKKGLNNFKRFEAFQREKMQIQAQDRTIEKNLLSEGK